MSTAHSEIDARPVQMRRSTTTDGAMRRANDGPVRREAPRSLALRPPCDRAEVRLTRLGRLVLTIALVAVALAVLMLVGSPAESTGAPHHPTAVTVVVEPGQTLWDIAQEVAPDEDPRVVIADILDLNALTDAGSIRAGQPLYVPAS